MDSILSSLLGYGLPGVALIGFIADAFWCRRNETRLNKHDIVNARAEAEFEKINEKLDLILDLFKGEKK